MKQGFNHFYEEVDRRFTLDTCEEIKQYINREWAEFVATENVHETHVILSGLKMVCRHGAIGYEFTVTFHSIVNGESYSRLTREYNYGWITPLSGRIDGNLAPIKQIPLDRDQVDPDDQRPVLLVFRLIKMTRRLCMDIEFQADHVTWDKEDHEGCYKFTASNGYEVISRSRPAVETERMWLLGGKRHNEDHSATKVCSNNETRDREYNEHLKAIHEWAAHNGGIAIQLP